MRKMDPIILGINHMFLCPESMTNVNVHTKTLAELAENPLMDALDCWVFAGNAKEEIEILRGCGKQINYNIGDRFGEVPIFPATTDKNERIYAMDVLKRETEFALESGAKKIIFGSGRDVPEDREGAKARYVEFVNEWAQIIPHDVCLTLEAIDRDVDKFFLLGTLEDTCECVGKWQKNGFNMGILLDMGHVPLLHESLKSAVDKTAPMLRHIHLGNCILKNRDNPFYGDKHVCWGAPDGEFDENDGTTLMHILRETGYFSRGEAQTVSFEMRPFAGMDAEATVKHLRDWFENTAATL